MIVYISGPISDIPNWNREAFETVSKKVVDLGHETVNPHDLFKDLDTEGYTWHQFMPPCIKALVDCDAVLTLPSWEFSRGAKLEVDIARALDKPVFSYHKFFEVYGASAKN